MSKKVVVGCTCITTNAFRYFVVIKSLRTEHIINQKTTFRKDWNIVLRDSSRAEKNHIKTIKFEDQKFLAFATKTFPIKLQCFD